MIAATPSVAERLGLRCIAELIVVFGQNLFQSPQAFQHNGRTTRQAVSHIVLHNPGALDAAIASGIFSFEPLDEASLHGLQPIVGIVLWGALAGVESEYAAGARQCAAGLPAAHAAGQTGHGAYQLRVFLALR